MNANNELVLFNKLFTDYQERFVRFAYSYTADRMASEDIVMESLMNFWENRKTLIETVNPPAYVLTSIKNKSLNFLRDRQTHLNVHANLRELAEWKLNVEISTLEACNPTELFSHEIQDKIKEALAQMPERTKRIFEMRRFEDKNCQEIADEMGISVKGVEYHLSKATAVMRESLKDYRSVLLFLIQI